jgi:hypothetical protein
MAFCRRAGRHQQAWCRQAVLRVPLPDPVTAELPVRHAIASELTEHSASPVAERRLEPPGHVPERELEAAADEERLAQSVQIGGIGDCVQRLAAPAG